MSGLTHFRYEILRTMRNRIFYAVTLGLPLALFYGVASSQRHVIYQGTRFPLYFMSAMAAYGAMFATVAPGARIARDRATGWLRQMRITPLRARTVLTSKAASSYLLALPTLVLLLLAGASLGVRLSASHWLELLGLLLVGLAPFVVMGFIVGYLLPTDAAAPAMGGLVVLFALLGGVFGFQLAKSGPLFDVLKCLPSYWLVQAGKTALGGSGWPAEAWIVIVAWVVVLIPVAALAYRRSASRA
jgi:ABC-2 type transport system permease protein